MVQIAPMQRKRGAHGVASLGNDVIAAGGWDASEFMSSAEAFDVRGGSWRELPPMAGARAYGAVVACNGGIVAVGGMQTADSHNAVGERWNGAVWEALSLDGSAALDRAFIATCVVDS